MSSSSSRTPQAASLSGIVTTADPSSSAPATRRVIPQTRRADGSYRKEIRVRDGYVPPEDVEKYANEKVATSARLAPGEVIGYAPSASSGKDESGAGLTKAQKKNERRKAAKQLAGEKGQAKESTKTSSASTPPLPSSSTKTAGDDHEGTAQSGGGDPAKKRKALQKKLRQAEQLKERSDAGEVLLPEQAEKVEKIDQLAKEIAAIKL